MKIFSIAWFRPFFHILLKTGGIESDILMPPEIEIPVWNFTQINQEWGQIAYFDNPISAYTSPNTGPKNLGSRLYIWAASVLWDREFMKIFWIAWLRYPVHYFHILLKTGGIESDIWMPPEIEIPVWNFTKINQDCICLGV